MDATTSEESTKEVWDAAAAEAAAYAAEDGWEEHGESFHRTVDVPVPEHERLEAALEALDLRRQEEELREHAKDERKRIVTQADAKGDEAAERESVAKQGTRAQMVEVKRLVNWRTLAMRVLRVDTDECVEERTLSASEAETLRMPKPIAEPEKQTTIDDAIAKADSTPPTEDQAETSASEPTNGLGDDDIPLDDDTTRDSDFDDGDVAQL